MLLYGIPVKVWGKLAAAILLKRRRRFSIDAVESMASLIPAACILNAQNTPRYGPALVTVNHYAASGFYSTLLPILVSGALAQGGTGQEVTWIITNAWTFPGLPLRKAFRKASEAVLKGIAETYGFLTMPPMPPAPEEAAERARSVQRLMRCTRDHPDAIIGLAPEGQDQPNGMLCLPPPGAGRLVLELARRGWTIYPVGIYEENGRLVVNFGAPYNLEAQQTAGKNEADLSARVILTRAIAACLPERLAGEFSRTPALASPPPAPPVPPVGRVSP